MTNYFVIVWIAIYRQKLVWKIFAKRYVQTFTIRDRNTLHNENCVIKSKFSVDLAWSSSIITYLELQREI